MYDSRTGKVFSLSMAWCLAAGLWQAAAWAQSAPDAEGAVALVAAAESELAGLRNDAERAGWVYNNFITTDTELIYTQASEALTAALVRYASEAARFSTVEGLDEVTARKLRMLRTGIPVPAPVNPDLIAEQAGIGARLSGMYGAGEACDAQGNCRDLQVLSEVMASSRDHAELLEAWNGWRTIAPPMKPMYARQAELANAGAQELGFADLGEMWRSTYDMPPDDFAQELDRLWDQTRPLYDALHCHVRAKLGEQYGTDLVPQDGPIPAHLLGNMWAQNWSNLYDLVGPADQAPAFDLDSLLLEADYDAEKMIHTGEDFFTSLGFEKLPVTFWERSLFTQPKDRNVVCHPSAWTIDEQDDVRIKMCTTVTATDFGTVHHELGHVFYYLAYRDQDFLHRSGANGGFHEAVGYMLPLSITPSYLKQVGLLDEVPQASSEVGLLMRQALDYIAFLPFGLVVDQWRWKVFAGEVGPDQYNELWWELRESYQGVAAPNQRPPDAFDPGAKFHVPANVSYTRYFLAYILQFQFQRSLCDITGHEGPLHGCSIYGNKEAGQALHDMLAMGRSKPWQDVLASLTGQSEMDATAILDYFAPLQEWLDEENEGRQCGW